MQYRRTLLVLCVLAYFGSRVGQVAVSPLVPEITRTFAISKGAIGAALTGMWAAYALVQYPAGLLADRFGERSVVLASLTAASGGGVLLAVAPTFPLFVVVLVCLGAGVGLYYNTGTALLARRFDEVGRAIGVHSIGAPAAGLLAPIAVAAVSVRFGWRTALLVGAAAAIPTLVLFWWHVRPTPSRRPTVRVRDRFDRTLVVDLLTRPSLARATAIAVLAEFVGMATTSFLPTFLVAVRGFSLTRASLLFSLYFVVVGASQPATGWLSDRVGRDSAATLTLVAGAVGYVALVGENGLPLAVGGVVLGGYAMSWSTPVQAQFIDLLDADERGAGFGLVRSVYVLLGSSGSVVVGSIADAFGWRAAFSVLGGLLLFAATLAGGARVVAAS